MPVLKVWDIIYLHVSTPWVKQHSPVPEPDWCLCLASVWTAYQWSLWTANHPHHKLMNQKAGNVGSLFSFCQMLSKKQNGKLSPKNVIRIHITICMVHKITWIADRNLRARFWLFIRVTTAPPGPRPKLHFLKLLSGALVPSVHNNLYSAFTLSIAGGV